MKNSTPFGRKAIKFFNELRKEKNLPSGLEILNPYENRDVKLIIEKFFNKFYDDNNQRTFVFGINPGRFGCGTTGIAFTDPVALREYCGIENNLGNRRELSSQFIYEMIKEFGGAEEFYSKNYITAIYPLALVKDDKNFNYYDDKKLYASLKNSITKSIQTQISFGAKNNMAVSLGKKNCDFLNEINNELKLFKKIETLEHPRYIMQYKRKTMRDYIKKYLNILK